VRRFILALFVILAASFGFGPAHGAAAGPNRVYVVHVDEMQSIDPTLARITRRTIAEARQDPQAVAVAFVINTPGGDLQSAVHMKDAILSAPVKTVAFVSGRAWSAGALIATSAEALYMQPGSTIGAAEPRVLGSNEPADYKTLSAVISEFRAAAKARGRDPELAQAMVDKNAKLPGQTTELLDMTSTDAVARGYADGEASSLEEALRLEGITDYTLVAAEMTFSDRVGRFLTTPWVAILLLVTGVIAIGMEFMKPGLTVPGLVGIICLGLFFLGNMLVGTAGWLELALALIGILLLIIEAFVPGFGIFGVAGVVAVAASIFLAVPTPEQAITYLVWTAAAFIVALFFIVRAIGRRGLGRALTLEKSGRDWTPPRKDLESLVGQEGKSLTVLRPAGTAQFGDLKVDVVTEGEFVPAGATVKVIRVEGTRVVVRQTEPPR